MINALSTEEHINLLLVEDNPGDARLIEFYLEEINDVTVDVKHVDTLALAIEALEGRNAPSDIDLVFLDLSLPDSFGMDTFEKTFEAAGGTPIIVLTGQSDHEMAVKAVQAGSEDFLIKNELDERILSRTMRFAMERYRRRQTEAVLQSATDELNVAARIQLGLLPNKMPEIDGFDIAGVSFPAEKVGGDYFDFIPMYGNRLGITIGDAMGHGLGPALMMAQTRACLRSLSRMCPTVDGVLELTNHILLEGMDDATCFVTLTLLRLDPRSKTLSYTNAGHPHGYVLSSVGEIKHHLDSTDLPLGVDPDSTFPTGDVIALSPGDVLFLYTDGVEDASVPHNPIFTNEQILSVVRDNLTKSALDIVNALYQAVKSFCDPYPPRDDITVVALKVLD